MTGLRQAWDVGARIYVQLSAGATLAAFARGSVDEAEAIVSVASEADDGGVGLLRVLGLCAAHGHAVDLTPFGTGLVPLPPVPLATQPYWGIADTAQNPLQVAGLAARGASAAPSPSGPPDTSGEAAAPPRTDHHDDVRARVLALVSKVSAFPVDALRENAKLLEDLGFDSLMANELSTRLTEVFPGFPGIPRALLAQSPSVADIVRHVEGSANAEAIPLTDPTRPFGRWAPLLRAAPPLGLLRAEPALVLNAPSLAALRALPPTDVVVRLEPTDRSPVAFGIAGFVRALAREWAPRKVQVVYGGAAEAAARRRWWSATRTSYTWTGSGRCSGSARSRQRRGTSPARRL